MAGLVELPFLPDIGQAVAVGIHAEGEIEADAFRPPPRAEGSGDFDGIEALAVDLDDEAEFAVRLERALGVGGSAGAHGFDLNVEFVVAVAADERGDGRALDGGAIFGEKHLGVISDYGLTGLIADRAKEDIVGSGGKGVDQLDAGKCECQKETRSKSFSEHRVVLVKKYWNTNYGLITR